MGVTCELTWNGISSNTLGIIVEGYPKTRFPEKDVETETVPGRNGALLIDHCTYSNYPQNYTINWRRDTDDFTGSKVAAWLYQKGYKRLEDSFYPHHFRIAYYAGGNDVENRINVLGRAKIQFQCKPQWFRKDGETELTLANGETLENSGQDANPLITINGSGKGTLTVGSVTVAISSIPEVGIVLDSDLQDSYSPDKLQNLNNLITLSGYSFPTIPTGQTTVSWNGGIESVKIIPRWWDLA